MTDARIDAVARADYNLSCGLAPEDESSWDTLGGKRRAESLARAELLVAAMDAADDRVRLTLPEFHAIKAETISDLSIDLHSRFGTDPAAQDILDFVAQQRAAYGDRYLEPVNHEAAMASLIRERTVLALHSTADSFDRASLESITSEMRDLEISPLVSPQFQRRFIQGCAQWLRTRADELDAEGKTLYYRVDTRTVIDQDRHTAVLNAVGRVVRRSRALAAQDRMTNAFIMTADLVEAVNQVGAVLPEEG
jgi:hypothetical protein